MTLGAAVALIASLTYVICGPKDFLGFPEPLWARIVFMPGSVAGQATYQYLSHSMATCYAVAIAATTLVGAVVGLMLDVLIGVGSRTRSGH